MRKCIFFSLFLVNFIFYIFLYKVKSFRHFEHLINVNNVQNNERLWWGRQLKKRSNSMFSAMKMRMSLQYDSEVIEVAERAPSELPNDFVDAVLRSVCTSLRCIEQGNTRIRIDFDTTVGDQTYSSLTNTMPMIKEFVKIAAEKMQLDFGPASDAVKSNGTIRVFFPDMGAAALARRDWKMNVGGYGVNDTNIEESAEVPPCVFTANIQNDRLESTDVLVIMLCPLYYEVDFVKRVLDMCDIQGISCIIVNPDLINMDQGFGVKARELRNSVINTFTTTYKLKTLPTGALVREWPGGFSLWSENENVEGGTHEHEISS